MRVFTAVVVDDEPLARESLRRLIESDERVKLVGAAKNGAEAIEIIEEQQPDVAFLDIMMPGITGLEVASAIGRQTQVIFTTAFEDFAVTAFELRALDYLLKPFGKRRFLKAVDRLTESSASANRAAENSNTVDTNAVEQLFVRERNRVLAIPVDSIVRIQAADDYAEVITDTSTHLLRVTMKQLGDQLNAAVFIRIHRSTIVNLRYVNEIVSCGNGRYEVLLSDGFVAVASRTGAARLRQIFR